MAAELLEVRALLTSSLATDRLTEVITWQGHEALVYQDEWIAVFDEGLSAQSSPSGAGSSLATILETSIQTVGNQWLPSRKRGVSQASVNAVATPPVASVLRQLGGGMDFLLKATESVDTKTLENTLRKVPGFRFLEPNFVVSIELTPNDPSFNSLWGQHTTSDQDIDAPEAWNLSTGSSSVVVGVIDTGVDYLHEDLADNMWVNPGECVSGVGTCIPDGIDNDGNGFIDDFYGWDFVNNDNDPMDDNSHGTHVAGTIAAVGNNAKGVVGVSWSSEIMALKFLDAAGNGSTSDAIEAINYATMMKQLHNVNIQLTNNSWGGGGFSQALYNAIAASQAQDMLFLAAAGNDGTNNDTTPHYPSSYALDNVISVASTDSVGNRSSFSNYGLTSVDLGAPGSSIYSTLPGNAYGYKSGTSMATPQVSGIAALAWSVDPDATYLEMRQAILNGAESITSMQGITVTGSRANAFNTLEELGLIVTSTTPGRDTIVTTAPTSFVVNFSDSVDSSTLQAADLTVNGIAANSFSIVDADTVQFTFSVTPVVTNGLQSMVMGADSVSRLSDADGLAGLVSTFYFDQTPLTVTGSTPANGGILLLPNPTIRVDFSEPFAPGSVQASDLIVSAGRVVSATIVDADTVEYQLADIVSETPLSVSLPVGAIRDLIGLPGQSFAATFNPDFGVDAWPGTLSAASPLGSLMYSSSLTGGLHVNTDTDSFTLNLDAGQSLSVAMLPAAGLAGRVRILSPSNAELALVTGTAGSKVLVQPVTIATSGVYTVIVSSNGSTSGTYTAELYLNSLLEKEAYGGAANNTRQNAESIDVGWTSLDVITSRLGVNGTFAGSADADWYEVTLTAPTPVSFLMSSVATGTGFSLHRFNGQLETSSVLTSTGDRLIQGYVPTATGTYYLQVTGSNAAYHLTATRNTTISVEANDALSSGQNIDQTRRVLGHVGSGAVVSNGLNSTYGPVEGGYTTLGEGITVPNALLEGAVSITETDGAVHVAWDGVRDPRMLVGTQGATENFLSINTAPEGDTPSDAIFTTNGQRFLVANRDSHNILVYDAATRAILADIPVNGEPVNLAISPDGNYAISANTSGNNIAIINLNTLTLQAEVPVSRAWPYRVKVTPDGQHAVVATAANYFVRISMNTFTQVGEIASADLGATSWYLSAGRRGGVYPQYKDFAITPDSSKLISPGGSGSSGSVRIYDLTTNTEAAVLPVSKPLYGVTVSADGSKAYLGSRFASGGDVVVEVGLATNSVLRTLNTETLADTQLLLTPDQQYLIAAGSNKLMFLNLTNGSTAGSVNVNPNDFALSYDGQYVLLGNLVSRVVSVQTRTQVAVLPSAYTEFVAVSPVDHRAIQGTFVFGEELAVVNINGSSSAQQALLSSGGNPEGDRPFDLAITPDGLTAITVNYESDNLSVVDLVTRTVTGYINTGVTPDDIAITPNGLHAVVTNPGNDTVSIIDIAAKTVVATLTGFIDDPRHVVISANGQKAYVNTTAANDSTDRVYFINLNGASSTVTGFLTVGNLANDAIQYSEMMLSPDGSLLAVPVSRDNEVVLISTASNTIIARVPTGEKPMEVEFSPDGSRLYTLNETSGSVSVIVVNGAASHRLTDVSLVGFVQSMAIDGTGNFLYVASWATAGVEVIDLTTHAIVRTLPALAIQPTDIRIVDDILYIVGSPGTPITLPLIDDRGTLARVLADGPDTVLIDELALSGVPLHLAYSEPLMMAVPVIRFDDGLDLISYLSEGTGDEDFYEFSVTAGDYLELSTALPGANPGLFENNLNIAVELYNSANQLLKRGIDGSLGYMVTSTGVYKARVYAQGFTSGEYLLSMETTPAMTLTVSPNSIAESSGTAVVTATLSQVTTSSVTIDLSVSGTAQAGGVDYALSSTQITIPAGQLQGTATITAADDSIAELAETIIIDIASVTNAVEDPAQQVSVTINDNDPPGFSVTQSGGSTSVSETGTTDSFDVVLTAAPLTNVVFTVTASNPAEAVVDKATLTFTPANWNVAQTVTVTGVDDPVVDGDQVSLITISVNDAASQDLFDPLPDATVSVTTTSNDTAGFIVAVTDGSTVVTEAGSTDTFDVALSAAPVTNVVMTVTVSDSGEASVNKTTLTFTPGNWNVSQTVAVTGVNDFVIDGSQISVITIAIDDANADNAFDPLSDAVVNVSTTDNDVAGFAIAVTGGTTLVSEQGTSDTFSVVLTAEPLSDVVLSVTSSDSGEVISSVSQVTFTSANWNQPQIVTVTGVDDLIADGVQTSTITLAIIDSLSDDNFDPLTDQTVSVTTDDNDDGILRGVKFEDLDGDGFRDADERGLPGVTIYLDTNNSGSLDVGEPTVVTGGDGTYEFTNLVVGLHVVREVVPAGHVQTTPGVAAAFFYGIDTNTDQLVRVAAGTGQVTRIGPHGAAQNITGIVYTSTGKIFGTQMDGTDSLYSIDPQTGDAALIGPTNTSIGGGMAYDSVSDTVYGLGFVNSVWTLVNFNRLTGVATPIGSGTSDLNTPTGLAFDAANQRIIAFDNADDQFVAFTSSGLASVIGASSATLDTFGLTFAGSTLVSSQHIDGTTLRAVDPLTGTVSAFVTLSEPVFFDTLEYVSAVDRAHAVSIPQSGILEGLDFGNDPLSAEIRGTKFEDINANGLKDAGEPALSGVTVYLDANKNGILDDGAILEPDHYAAGTTIGNLNPEVTVRVSFSGDVPVLAQSAGIAAINASTGTRVFSGAPGNDAFSSTGFWLEIDITDTVNSVSIDFTAIDAGAAGKLNVFNAAQTLLGTYSTAALAAGESATMQIFAPGIAYAVATSTNSLKGTLDHLKLDGGMETRIVTDVNGNYLFSGLAPGEYTVREIVPEGFRQTSPVTIGAQRLFAVDPRAASATQIVEIDPATGATLNSFNAPGGVAGTTSGLAFDGQTVYFIDSLGDTLFQLNPNTGAVLNSLPMPAAGRWDGLAVLGGEVYANEPDSDVIYVINPATNSIARTITLNIGSNSNPFGSLGELPDGSGGQLIGGVASSQTIALLNPVTGAVNSTFAHATVSSGSHFGLTSLNGQIYIGFNNSTGTVQVYSPTGTFIRSFQAGFDISGLAGASEISGKHVVTLVADQLVTGLDFGNERLLGDISGRKFEDKNGNGTQDAGENGMAGVTVYLDANGNGALNAGELSMTTDVNGNYSFLNIPVGDYVVREVIPAGFVQTTPATTPAFYYAINTVTDTLVKINALNGAMTTIGPHNAGDDRLQGLVVTNSGAIIASNFVNDSLYSVNATTGVATVIGSAQAQIGGGLGYDSATDTVYGIVFGGAGAVLARFNQSTGVATPIGPGVANLTAPNGIEFDPVTGKVIVFDSSGGEFFGFNTLTGIATVLSTASPTLSTFGLTSNGTDLLLTSAGQVFQLNLSNGTRTPVLTLSTNATLDGLEYVAAKDGSHRITLDADEVLTNLNFGNRRAVGEIRGTKFEDLNGDKVKNPGEIAMPNVVVYLDSNNNNVLDGGELSTQTNSTGDYTFENVPVGDYVVREVIPSGYVQTTPGQSDSFFYALNLSTSELVRISSVSGIMTTIGLHGQGGNLNGLIVTNAGQLIAGSWQTDRLYSLNPITGLATEIGLANANIGGGLGYDSATDTIYGVVSGGAGTQLATFNRTTGLATGFGPGVANLTGTTGIEFDPVTGKVIVYDSVGGEYFGFDPATGVGSVLSVATPSLSTFGLTSDGTDLLQAAGNQLFRINVSNGTRTPALTLATSVNLDGLEFVRGQDQSHRITVGVGDVLTGRDFGNRRATGEIRGTKFNDLNADGVRDAGEGVLSGVTIYLDSNNNGVLNSGEPSTLTDVSGNYVFANIPVGNYTVREVNQTGHTNTAPGYSQSFFYALDHNTQQLVRIDSTTGQVTRIGSHNAGVLLDGLVVTKTGQLFASTPVNPDRLFSLNPVTGAATQVGFTGGNIGGDLAYDPITDTLYTVGFGTQSHLAIINRTTGAATIYGPGVANLSHPLGITFDPVTRSVITFDDNGDEFFSFDPATGIGTQISISQQALSSSGFAATESGFVMSSSNTTLINMNPYTGIRTPYLTLSESVLVYALAYVRGADAAHRVTVNVGDVLNNLDFGSHYVPPTPQETAPAIPNGGGTNRSGIGTLAFSFDMPVTATSPSALRLYNHTTQQLINVSSTTISGNGTSTLTWNLASTTLPRGRYTAEVWASQIITGEGMHPDVVRVTEFLVNRGDMNGDGRVNTADYAVIGANFDPLPGAPYRNGDANGDGRVNTSDYAIIGANFNPLLLTTLQYDFGDAPETGTQFATTLVNDGARHILGSGLRLGAAVDAEANGLSTSNADGDGTDDDGLVFGTLQQGQVGTVTVTAVVPGAAVLNVWIDLDHNGIWELDNGEHVINDVPVSNGIQALPFNIPANAPLGSAMVRARITAAPGVGPSGLASSGEVEDSIVQIEAPITEFSVAAISDSSTLSVPETTGDLQTLFEIELDDYFAIFADVHSADESATSKPESVASEHKKSLFSDQPASGDVASGEIDEKTIELLTTVFEEADTVLNVID